LPNPPRHRHFIVLHSITEIFTHNKTVSLICRLTYTRLKFTRLRLTGTVIKVIVSLINDRPSMNSFSTSEELQEFTRARYIRIRLLDINTLHGHLMSSNRDDPTVKKRYFYSIKNIEIGGRCVCNGHAEQCFEQNGQFACDCKHNTQGRNSYSIAFC